MSRIAYLSWILRIRCAAEERKREDTHCSAPSLHIYLSKVSHQHGSPCYNVHNHQLKESAKFPLRGVGARGII